MVKLKRIHRVILLGLLVIGAFLAGSILNRPDAGLSTSGGKDFLLEGNRADAEQDPDLTSWPPGSVFIGRSRRDMIGIQSAPVGIEAISHTFRFLGRVAADETRLYIINAAVDGWITSTSPVATGSYVRKNDVLAGFYSPEFLTAAQNLFFTLNARDQFLAMGDATEARKQQLTQFIIELKRFQDGLRKLGMGDPQIEKMTQSREWKENVEIVSPTDGFILSRSVSDGLRFTQGTELFRVADLSRIWIFADVYEQEAQYLKPGAAAAVLLPYQKKDFRANVSNILPEFDASTRTLKVRLEADNPGFVLRPGMFADVEMPVTLPPALTVPSGAILYTGVRSVVYVDAGNGVYVPRTVETGWRLGDRVEITDGLRPGERIVLAGNFFVDSESRLQAAAQGIYGAAGVDPVSGEAVDEAKAAAAGLTSVHQGKTFSFATPENKARFDRDPAFFVKPPAGKREDLAP